METAGAELDTWAPSLAIRVLKRWMPCHPKLAFLQECPAGKRNGLNKKRTMFLTQDDLAGETEKSDNSGQETTLMGLFTDTHPLLSIHTFLPSQDIKD